MLHASRLHEGHWSSKHGDGMLMIHNRTGFNRSSFYGSIVTSFEPQPTATVTAEVTVPVVTTEVEPVEPAVIARLEKLTEQITKAFPVVADSFEASWKAWKSTWGS